MPQQLSGVDAEQEKFMEQEMIALLDKNDCVIGGASKRECHERTKEFPNGRLHRAFSVFLFNSKNELLLQKRASSKITFPNLWTNTCCSHPLYNGEELADENHIGEFSAISFINLVPKPFFVLCCAGIKRAAVRKLEHELGISPKEIRPTDFHFLTRIEYQAFQTDEKWTEHESMLLLCSRLLGICTDWCFLCIVDYILVGKMDTPVSPNPNEVSDVRFVDQKELKSLIENDKSGITPWFSLIAKQHLFGWWDQLGNIIAQGGLESEQEANTIHRMGVYDPK